MLFKNISFLMLLFQLTIGNAGAQTIDQAEYFFDVDPGISMGSVLSIPAPGDSVLINTEIPVKSLTPGFHTLFIRFRYTSGIWSLTEGRGFYIDTRNIAPPPLTHAEYFFDNDPGIGNGTELNTPMPQDSVSIHQDIPTKGLTAGFHSLFVRFTDSSGTWGLAEGRGFYINEGSLISTKLTGAEYFFDNDPGVGRATSLSVITGDSIYLSKTPISILGLPVGSHTIFTRFKDSTRVWGLTEGRIFNVIVCNLKITTITIDTTICQGNSTLLNSYSTDNWLTYQWLKDNTLLNSTNNFLFAETTGSFYVIATDTIGCSDTSNIIRITVKPLPDVRVTLHIDTLTANQNGAIYQWLDCKRNYGFIDGSVKQSIKALPGSSYAVIVSLNGCSDTSDCSGLNSSNMDKNEKKDQLLIYPNPSKNSITIQSSSGGNYSIINELGQTIREFELNNANNYSMLINTLNSGVFMVIGIDNNRMTSQKVVILK